MDSTGVLELVAFLEESFHLQIADKKIIPQNLDTIDAIKCLWPKPRNSVYRSTLGAAQQSLSKHGKA